MISSTGEVFWLPWSCAILGQWLGCPVRTLHCASGLAGADLVSKVWPWHPDARHPPSLSSSPPSPSSSHPSFSLLTSSFLLILSTLSLFLLPLSSFSSSLSHSPPLSPSLINIPAQGRKTRQISFLSLAGLQTVTGPLCVLASRSLPLLLPALPPAEGLLEKRHLRVRGEEWGRERQRLP